MEKLPSDLSFYNKVQDQLLQMSQAVETAKEALHLAAERIRFEAKRVGPGVETYNQYFEKLSRIHGGDVWLELKRQVEEDFPIFKEKADKLLARYQGLQDSLDSYADATEQFLAEMRRLQGRFDKMDDRRRRISTMASDLLILHKPDCECGISPSRTLTEMSNVWKNLGRVKAEVEAIFIQHVCPEGDTLSASWLHDQLRRLHEGSQPSDSGGRGSTLSVDGLPRYDGA